MTDLDKALAAAREARAALDAALAKPAHEYSYAEVDEARERYINATDDLIAALDAARGEAVATVQTITSLVGETRKCIIGPAEVIDSLPVGTAVYAAPPAALAERAKGNHHAK